MLERISIYDLRFSNGFETLCMKVNAYYFSEIIKSKIGIIRVNHYLSFAFVSLLRSLISNQTGMLKSYKIYAAAV